MDSKTRYEAKLIDDRWRVGMEGNLDTIHDAVIVINHGPLKGGIEEAGEIAAWIVARHNEEMEKPRLTAEQFDRIVEACENPKPPSPKLIRRLQEARLKIVPQADVMLTTEQAHYLQPGDIIRCVIPFPADEPHTIPTSRMLPRGDYVVKSTIKSGLRVVAVEVEGSPGEWTTFRFEFVRRPNKSIDHG